MNSRPTKDESAHMERVKRLSCGVCGAAGPSEADHWVQGLHYLVMPLCVDCHRGPHGRHGDKTRWRIFKMDEQKVLNNTIRNLYG